MTPSEAIAALEAAYPKFTFAICQSVQTVFQRMLGGEIHELPSERWCITTYYQGRSFSTTNKHRLADAVADVTSFLTIPQTQRAIEQVAAGLTDEALLKRP